MYEQRDLQLVSFILSNSLRGGGINRAEDVGAGIVYGVTGDSSGIQRRDKNQVIEGLTIERVM